MKYVIKLTGKLFSKEHVSQIKEIVDILRKQVKQGSTVVVVTGGGKVAREYVSLGSELGISQAGLDLLGIESSRLNALILALLINEYAYLPIPRSVDEVMNALRSSKLVITGGLQPGQSTNAVSAIIAELLGADLLINATVVDGVYDKDPKLYSDAKLLKEITVAELEKVIRQTYEPGHYELLDPLALMIIKRSKIPLVFVNALKPYTILKVMNNDRSVGTWVLHR